MSNESQIDNLKAIKKIFEKFCTFKNTGNVALFTENYKFSNSLGLKQSRRHLTNRVFYNGGRPNLLKGNLVKPDWLQSRHICGRPRLKPVISQRGNVIGCIVLRSYARESKMRLLFRSVRYLDVIVFSSILFIDELKRSFIATNRKNVPLKSTPFIYLHHRRLQVTTQKNNEAAAHPTQ